MKIYKPQPIDLVRLQIARKGEDTKYLTFCETTLVEAKEVIKNLIADNVKTNPFESKKRTSLSFRDALGGKNGKSETISFFGLSTIETEAIIINHLQKV